MNIHEVIRLHPAKKVRWAMLQKNEIFSARLWMRGNDSCRYLFPHKICHNLTMYSSLEVGKCLTLWINSYIFGFGKKKKNIVFITSISEGSKLQKIMEKVKILGSFFHLHIQTLHFSQKKWAFALFGWVQNLLLWTMALDWESFFSKT